MATQFFKYEGAGNDFVMLLSDDIAPERVRALCDRHRGVGADGVILLSNGPRMRYFNADGSQGEMCGNGARCFALFAHDLGLFTDVLHFEAMDGPHTARLLDDGRIEISMTEATFEQLPDGIALDTGVPHFVVFDAPDEVVERGRALRHDPRFARGTNVDFLSVESPGRLRVRTYERGVEDETMACGTGATAAAMAAHLQGDPALEYTVRMPGGVLGVRFDAPAGGVFRNVFLSGPARRVFTGSYDD